MPQKKTRCVATVIIPVLNEKDNAPRLCNALRKMSYYVIIADDGSTDGTREAIEKISAKDDCVIFFDHSKFPNRGLAGSVLDAAALAQTEKIVVMDADFQHPPEKVAELVAALNFADIAVGCRTKNQGWTLERELISWGANTLSKLMLLLRGAAFCSDPLSGFFAFRKSMLTRLDRRRVVENGFKVLLDILKQLPASTRLAEVLYVFTNRTRGDSKFAAKHVLFFLRSLIS